MFWSRKSSQQLISRPGYLIGRAKFTGADLPDGEKKISKALFCVLLFLFAGVVFFVFFFSSFLKITDISIEGTEQINPLAVKNAINRNFAEKHLLIFSKNNFIFVRSESLEEDLEREFPKIKIVDVKKTFPDSVRVFVTERSAVFVWCRGNSAPEIEGESGRGDCLLVDEDGYGYAAADFNSPEIKENNLVEIYDGGRSENISGDRVIPKEFLRFAAEIGKILESNLQIKIKNRYFTPSRFSEEIKIQTEEGWWLYFSTQFSPDSAVKTLKLFLEKETGVNRAEIEYIDLRMENKIYYKIKKDGQPDDESRNEEQSAPAPESETEKNKKKR